MSKKSPKSDKSSAVIRYISVLFGTAFLLLLMTYFMEHRQSAEAIEGLRSSVSAMQTAEQLRVKSEQLSAQVEELEEKVQKLEQEAADREEEFAEEKRQLEILQKEGSAQVLFLEILLSENQEEKEILIDKMQKEGLSSYLSNEAGENGEPSPKEQFLALLR